MKVYKTKEYRIMSVTSGKLLTANEDQLITVEAADEQKAQNWKFFPEENGCYRIVSTKSKKVVDIIAGGTVNGAWVHQWETVSANSQLWKLEEDVYKRQSDDDYRKYGGSRCSEGRIYDCSISN